MSTDSTLPEFRHTQRRREVVAALAAHGGKIESPNGKAVAILRSYLPGDGARTRGGSLTSCLAAMERQGIIRRVLSPGGANTRAIILVDPKGLLSVNGNGNGQATNLTPEQPTLPDRVVPAVPDPEPKFEAMAPRSGKVGLLETASGLLRLPQSVRTPLSVLLGLAEEDPDAVTQALNFAARMMLLDPDTRDTLDAIVADYESR